jgi:hypothetical protein
MRRRQERFIVVCSLVLVWSTISMGAQESTNSALLEKSRQALTKRDYTHALELLKQVDPARRERTAMLAVANGMACQTQVVVSQHDPSADAQCALAKQFFTQVLSHSANDGLALSWLGALSYDELGSMRGPARFAKLNEVRGYFTTLLAAHPDDPESDYWLGVTAWLASYWRNQDARADYNRNSQTPLRWNDPLPEAVRIELARQCGDMVNKGVEGLQKLVDQQSKDLYSLAYLNLLFRQRADLQKNDEMRAKDLRTADQLVSRIRELQKSEVLTIDIPLHPAIPPPPPPPPVQSPKS